MKLKAIAAIGIGALTVPLISLADDYPNGASATGLVVNIGTWGSMFRFVVQGTMDNGGSGSTAFWLDMTTTGASARAANIMAAASQGKTVNIWNYGSVYNYGGQGGYWSSIEFVNF